MKLKTIIIALLLSTIAEFTIAQPAGGECNREQIEAKKIAFITDAVSLTVAEAQAFWPLYNELEAKRKELEEKRRSLFHSYIDNPEGKTDAEIAKIGDDLIALDLEEAKLSQTYHQKFRQVLSAEKVLLYYHAEKEFRHFLLRQLRARGMHE